MASKQLGKLRQWAGEVISSRERTVATDEFRELEKDIDVRKEGIRKIHIASQAYHHALAKKKEAEALESEPAKLLPVDALGVVMITHGEELGEDSTFGSALVKFGRAHCKVATLQEAFTLTFQDSFLTAMQRYEDEIKDYQTLKKKLDSRRLSFDAAISKAEKLKSNKKAKEKERNEAEDEMQKAESRYEETLEDVRAMMVAIQENELQQVRDLTTFLDLETNFAQQYLEVMKDVKSNWVDVPSVTRTGISRSKVPSRKSSPSRDHSRHNSVRSHKSSGSKVSLPASSDEESDAETPGPRHQSFSRRKSDAASKAPSRTPSRASRKRSDSSATAGSVKEKPEKDKFSARMSVTGWASSAVSTMTGRGKKDKDKFAALKDDDSNESDEEGSLESEASPASKFSSMSKPKDVARSSASIAMRKSATQSEKKMVKALYDFTGSADELSFKIGDQITVLQEVVDGWWMGELDGKTGLFPRIYTEIVPSSIKSTPAVPQRPKRSSTMPHKMSTTSLSSVGRIGSARESDTDGYGTSDMEQEQLYVERPLATERNSVYGSFDVESIQSSLADGEEDQRLMPGAPSQAPTSFKNSFLPPALTSRVKSDPTSASASGKRAPPPPPPRRSSNNSLGTSGSSFTNSDSSATDRKFGSVGSIATLAKATSHNASPFDSPRDSTFDFTAGCRDFKQNPFKPPGMCSNCFQLHG